MNTRRVNTRRVLLLAFVLLLASSGPSIAQSPATYVVKHVVTTSSGSTSSATYAVDAVIGQPIIGSSASASFKVSSGFLLPQSELASDTNRTWLPILLR